MDMETGKMSLKGQHLRILPFQSFPAMDIKRNESGHIVQITGHAMDWLEYVVRSMNLTYTMLEDDVRIFEDDEVTGKKGSTSYMIEKKADVAVGGMVMAVSVNEVVDYTYPLDSSTFGLMIPPPQSTTYFGGTWMPFSFQVWLVLLFSVLFISGLFYSFIHIELKKITKNTSQINIVNQIYNAIDHAFRSILNQGTSLTSSLLSFRILAGTWALGCFLLVNYYGSILTSFFTAPNYVPFMKSIYELPKNPGINPTANAVSAPAFFFRGAEEGIEKYLNELWHEYPKLMCNTTEQCLEQVLEGTSIYIEVYPAILHYIGMDLEKTGKCRFTVAENSYRNFHSGFQLPKGSPFTQMFSREFLKAEAAGLQYAKKSKQQANAYRCIGKYNKVSADDGYPLTLKNLSSAFILLPVGYLLSFFILCIEKLIAINSYKKRMTINAEQGISG